MLDPRPGFGPSVGGSGTNETMKGTAGTTMSGPRESETKTQGAAEPRPFFVLRFTLLYLLLFLSLSLANRLGVFLFPPFERDDVLDIAELRTELTPELPDR